MDSLREDLVAQTEHYCALHDMDFADVSQGRRGRRGGRGRRRSLRNSGGTARRGLAELHSPSRAPCNPSPAHPLRPPTRFAQVYRQFDNNNDGLMDKVRTARVALREQHGGSNH